MASNVDCVQTHPANALDAWTQVLTPFKESETYLEDWIKEGAYNGLQHGKRNPSDGSYQDFDQPKLITQRFSINKLLEDVATESQAKEKACVAVWDKNNKELMKSRSTKCARGTSCATLNQDGYFESAAHHAEQVGKRTGQGAVARGFCVKSWHQMTSNLQNRHHKNEWLQKAERLIDEQRQQLRKLENRPESQCKNHK